jgi:kinesin family protein 3/17
MLGLPNNQGIIPNAFQQVFGYIDDSTNNNKKFLVRASYLELYNEDVRDLLSDDIDRKLDLKEGAKGEVSVKDLTIINVKSVREIEHLMNRGNSLRKVGATAMNETSSRSHSLFTIYLETLVTARGGSGSATNSES